MLQKIKIVLLTILGINIMFNTCVLAVENYNNNVNDNYISLDAFNKTLEYFGVKVYDETQKITILDNLNKQIFSDTNRCMGNICIVKMYNNLYFNYTNFGLGNAPGSYYVSFNKGASAYTYGRKSKASGSFEKYIPTPCYSISTNSASTTATSRGNNSQEEYNIRISLETIDNTTIINSSQIYTYYGAGTAINIGSALYHSKNYYADENYIDNQKPEEPETPSGDNSENTSGDNNGNTGNTQIDYSEKLDNINGTLNNIENKIPTSGDIQNSVAQGNKDYWGQPSGEELKKEQEENINQIKEELTSNLENNEIMGALTTAEQGFIELLQGEPGDFKISWNEVKYMDTKLIPSGEINFSKIARETESIGMIKTTLNIILSGFMALNILKYIYNLLLTTLGIDNPMIIDTSSENTTTVTETSKIKMASGKTVTQTKKYKGGN